MNRHAVWQIHDNVVARLVGAAVYGYPWDAGYSKESWESESVELEFEETGIENSESHDTENGSSQDAAKNEICAVQETDLCIESIKTARIDPRWRVRISWDLPTQHRRSDCFTGYYRKPKVRPQLKSWSLRYFHILRIRRLRLPFGQARPPRMMMGQDE